MNLFHPNNGVMHSLRFTIASLLHSASTRWTRCNL